MCFERYPLHGVRTYKAIVSRQLQNRPQKLPPRFIHAHPVLFSSKSEALLWLLTWHDLCSSRALEPGQLGCLSGMRSSTQDIRRRGDGHITLSATNLHGARTWYDTI